MFDRNSKIILTFFLTAMAGALFLADRKKIRGFALLAMALGTAGDLLLAGVFGGGADFYIGSLCFVAEHLVNGGNFLAACRRKGSPVCGASFGIGAGIAAAAAVLLGILAFTVPDEPQTAMFFLILVYIAAIGFNLTMQFSFAQAEGGLRWLIAAGMLLFLFSDYVIFLDLLGICPYSDNLCWLTYVPAQALTILFCAGFRREGKNV